jgi:hypothetical protein
LLHSPHGSVLVSYENAFGGAVVDTAAELLTAGAVSVGGGVDLVPDRRPGSIVSAGVVDVGAVTDIAGVIKVAGFEEVTGITDAAGVTGIVGVIRVAVGAVKKVACGVTEVAGSEEAAGSEGDLKGLWLDLSLTIKLKTVPLYLVLSISMHVAAAAIPPTANSMKRPILL